MELTREELAVIKSRLPFLDGWEPGEDRLKAVADFMHDAEKLHLFGPQHLMRDIVAVDDDGNEIRVSWEPGDSSVGLESGWAIDGVVTLNL